jgi:sugar lactone lactonase YvrE
VAARALLGECPVWSGAEQVLYWIDIDGRRVHRFDPTSGRDDERTLHGRPGSIGLTPEPGRLLVAAEHEVGDLRWTGGAFEPWVKLEPAGSGNRLNDGRVGPGGRFWVGSMFERPTARRFTGMLHRVDADGTVTTHRRGVGVSNSLAFAPDGRTMYWSDTAAGTVWSHVYDPGTGEPGRAQLFADFSGLPGLPDGACVDDSGAVWIAGVTGGALVRITPGGELDRVIEVPVGSPTMPAFGGAALDTLFVTSIGSATSVLAPVDGPLDGSLLALDVGVRGVPEPVFAR